MAAVCSSCAPVTWSSFVLVRSWQEATQNELKAWWDVHQHGWHSPTRTGGTRPHLAPRRCLVVSEIIYICNIRPFFPRFPRLDCCLLECEMLLGVYKLGCRQLIKASSGENILKNQLVATLLEKV